MVTTWPGSQTPDAPGNRFRAQFLEVRKCCHATTHQTPWDRFRGQLLKISIHSHAAHQSSRFWKILHSMGELQNLGTYLATLEPISELKKKMVEGDCHATHQTSWLFK